MSILNVVIINIIEANSSDNMSINDLEYVYKYNLLGIFSIIINIYNILSDIFLIRTLLIDIKKVDKQFTHAMHVKDRHVNDTFIDKFTKWYQ